MTDVLGLGGAGTGGSATNNSALMLLVDGLGAALLEEHAADAPTLAALTAGRSLDAGFPASTSISVTSLGTGLPPGAHGVVGLTMNVDGHVLDTLKWTVDGRDASALAVPEQLQPHPTVFEQVRAAGFRPVVVSSYLFANSALTRAALRGADYRGTVAHGDLAAAVLDELRVPGTLVYAYASELDTVGHVTGPGSPAWRFQLREIDHLVALLVDGLPPGTVMTVTGDHGMVRMAGDAVVDYDDTPALQQGVRLIAGEPRVRYLHVADADLEGVRTRWTDVLGDQAWIGTRAEVEVAGLLGPLSPAPAGDDVRSRVGDLVVVATGTGGVVRRTAERVVSSLIGQHGSWTDAERRVALAVHRA
jgi:predicted AlkP superfamily pyrophosphatase or phosphodiesterase